MAIINSRRILKIITFSTLLLTAGISGCSHDKPEKDSGPAPVTDYNAPILALIKDKENTGYAVIDYTTGSLLCSHHGKRNYIPASVSKLITVQAAFSILGNDYHAVTSVCRTGEVKDGTLHGDLYLKGGADPMLCADDIRSLAVQFENSGIRRVDGNCCYDDTCNMPILRISPVKGLSGLVLTYEYGRINRDGQVIRAPEDPPFFKSAGNSDYLSSAPGFIKADEVSGFFFDLLRNAGIKCGHPSRGRCPSEAVTVASHISAPLVQSTEHILAYSINHSSEILFVTAARQLDKDLSDYTMCWNAIKDYLDFPGISEASILSGSGLASSSRISPESLAVFFSRQYSCDYNGKRITDLIDPYAGGYDADGRLSENISRNISAKTGSLAFVHALCGRIRTKGGRDLLFAYMSTDYENRKKYESGIYTQTAPGEWRQNHLDDQAAFLRILYLF